MTMPSYVSLLIHFVWSTAQREPLIRPSWQDQLYGYFGGILRNKGGVLIAAGGMADHVHVLASLPSTVDIAQMAGALKSNSSGWIHKNIDQCKSFRWQSRYGAFSVSRSLQDTLIEYIHHQADHHCGRTFQEEFLALLKKHCIEYDERFLWD